MTYIFHQSLQEKQLAQMHVRGGRMSENGLVRFPNLDNSSQPKLLASQRHILCLPESSEQQQQQQQQTENGIRAVSTWWRTRCTHCSYVTTCCTVHWPPYLRDLMTVGNATTSALYVDSHPVPTPCGNLQIHSHSSLYCLKWRNFPEIQAKPTCPSPEISYLVNSYKHCITHSAISYLLKVNRLQKDYFGGASAGKLYDRVVALTQDITVSLNSEKRLFSHRYLMSPHALLSSHRYLISPRTRFSLKWRMTVTNCLMLEIFRLCASHHLSGTFSISLAQIIGRLLVECKAPEQTKNHLKHITTQIKKNRRHFFEMLPIFGPKPADITVCIPSGPQALLILQFGRML